MVQSNDIQYRPGDVVRMKKTHPCGSDIWEITRTGMDFGLRCRGCGHHVMMPRARFVRAVRGLVEPDGKN